MEIAWFTTFKFVFTHVIIVIGIYFLDRISFGEALFGKGLSRELMLTSHYHFYHKSSFY